MTANRYATHTTEDTTDWSLGGTGRLDIVRGSSLNVGADTGEYTEPRTTTSTQFLSVTPIRYYQSDAYASLVREVNRIRLSVRGDWQDLVYENGKDANGNVISQQAFDHTVTSALGRADYAVSPDTALFVQLTGNWRDYRLNPPLVTPSRQSSGVEALGGANFDLTSLVRGELGVGYISQSYTDKAFSTINGLGFRGQVEWFPTQLTTVTANLGDYPGLDGLNGSCHIPPCRTGS